MAESNTPVVAAAESKTTQEHLAESESETKDVLDSSAAATDDADEKLHLASSPVRDLSAVDPELGTAQDSDGDSNVVYWDGPDDPQNPYNWPRVLKVFNCVLISALTFVTPLASCKSMSAYQSFCVSTDNCRSHVRTWSADFDARVWQHKRQASFVLCVRLYSRIRHWSFTVCTFVRIVRSSLDLPRLQCRLHRYVTSHKITRKA